MPAYFDAPQVEATRKAGELAGLDVIGILQEPTAAAIYHTWKRRLDDGNFLVYDLGGGTFDVSILRCVGGEYQVLAIDGDNYLGGDDFDRRYAEHLRKQLVDEGLLARPRREGQRRRPRASSRGSSTSRRRSKSRSRRPRSSTSRRATS